MACGLIAVYAAEDGLMIRPSAGMIGGSFLVRLSGAKAWTTTRTSKPFGVRSLHRPVSMWRLKSSDHALRYRIPAKGCSEANFGYLIKL